MAVTNTDPVIKLLGYQRKLVLDESRFICAKMARGTRKSWTGTLKVVRKIMHKEAAGGRNTCIIASRGERQSLVAIAFAKQHAKAYSLAISAATEEQELTNEFGVRVLDESGFPIKYKVHTITFPNGSQIIGVPANPDTLRGYTGDLLLDEFAFHKDSRAIWGAVFPIIRESHDLLILSTPNGKSNKFYEIASLADPVWSQHVVTIVDAVNQGLPFNLDQQRRALNDDDLWQQEYMLEWLDEASAWLDYDLINSCEHELAGIPAHYTDGACYGGEDIAIRGDLWVGWVKEKLGDVLWTREIRVLRRASFLEQDRNRNELFAKYRMLRYCMDQTGMGEKPVEDAKRKHGELRVEGVIFTLQTKLLLATCIKQSMQDKKERIPMGDDALRIDLHKIKKEPTATGAARFVADSDSAGHADRFWAGAIATYAASNTPMVYDFTRVDPSRGMDEVEDDEDGRFERISPHSSY